MATRKTDSHGPGAAPDLHPTQKLLLNAITASPGVFESRLAAAALVSRTNARYHLRRLGQAGLVHARSHGRKVHYFPRGLHVAGLQLAFIGADGQTRRRLLESLRQSPGRSLRELAQALDVTPRAVRWHLKRLAAMGLVQTETQGAGRMTRINELLGSVLDARTDLPITTPRGALGIHALEPGPQGAPVGVTVA